MRWPAWSLHPWPDELLLVLVRPAQTAKLFRQLVDRFWFNGRRSSVKGGAVSDQRRQRLESLINPLLNLNDFSSAEAKQHCSESTPGYVTMMLGQLVREGVLREHLIGDEVRFRWQTPQTEFRTQEWINRQIHGLQVKETPEHLRPRERLLRDGARALSDADLLAILIRVGVRNESAIVGAQRIANRFASRLDDLAKYSPEELKEISPAATKASYTQIMAGIELGRRIARLEATRVQEKIKITSTNEAVEYCRIEFARLASDGVQEEFHIVTLDTKHKPIYSHCITIGTLDASLVHPREVFRPAIRDSASAILLVHNHPSGDPTPSREDHQVTQQLTDAGKLLGITVLDHIIVAKERCVSIREIC
jgi:DNA repair protein RadC